MFDSLLVVKHSCGGPLDMATSIPSEKDTASASKDKPTVSAAQTSSASDKIKQAKNLAVAQAQQEGSKGNFRIFDSPFGNFLVPVIPTRAELGG
nr:uncharacterized protein LOC109186307 isoform X1 [Ipomoea batatas]